MILDEDDSEGSYFNTLLCYSGLLDESPEIMLDDDLNDLFDEGFLDLISTTTAAVAVAVAATDVNGTFFNTLDSSCIAAKKHFIVDSQTNPSAVLFPSSNVPNPPKQNRESAAVTAAATEAAAAVTVELSLFRLGGFGTLLDENNTAEGFVCESTMKHFFAAIQEESKVLKYGPSTSDSFGYFCEIFSQENRGNILLLKEFLRKCYSHFLAILMDFSLKSSKKILVANSNDKQRDDDFSSTSSNEDDSNTSDYMEEEKTEAMGATSLDKKQNKHLDVLKPLYTQIGIVLKAQGVIQVDWFSTENIELFFVQFQYDVWFKSSLQLEGHPATDETRSHLNEIISEESQRIIYGTIHPMIYELCWEHFNAPILKGELSSLESIDPTKFPDTENELWKQKVVSVSSYLCNVISRYVASGKMSDMKHFFYLFIQTNTTDLNIARQNPSSYEGAGLLIDLENIYVANKHRKDESKRPTFDTNTGTPSDQSAHVSNTYPGEHFYSLINTMCHYLNIYFSTRSVILRLNQVFRKEQEAIVEFLWARCETIEHHMNKCIESMPTNNPPSTEFAFFGKLLLKKLISAAVRASGNCVSKRISETIKAGFGVSCRTTLQAFMSNNK